MPNRAESLEAEQERNRLRRPTPSKKTEEAGIPFSLFAPNVAFTYRKPQEAEQLVDHAA